ncbi:LolA family protein [Novosphingobium sp. 9]|uniref:LolA family protein n=1 Tax=Novosphingobium sp. 9 TaxID=2025349 RepID=UPI0021B69679|nr:outer membrane lipoprotein carrier protein LolA [Novosphingobium sp. 9]
MNRYRKTFRSCVGAAVLAALSVPAVSISSPALAADSSAAQMQQVVAALRGITTMTADFAQSDRNGSVVTGKLTLQRPGRIRFQYEPSVHMLIVGDGKALTLIDYDVNQVSRWPIGNSPLGAILDPKRDVSKLGVIRPTGNPNVISVEVRDSSHPEYGVITLIFTKDASAPGGLELSYWVALDAQNQRTTIRLTNQRYGVAIPSNAFKWNDPRVKAGHR